MSPPAAMQSGCAPRSARPSVRTTSARCFGDNMPMSGSKSIGISSSAGCWTCRGKVSAWGTVTSRAENSGASQESSKRLVKQVKQVKQMEQDKLRLKLAQPRRSPWSPRRPRSPQVVRTRPRLRRREHRLTFTKSAKEEQKRPFRRGRMRIPRIGTGRIQSDVMPLVREPVLELSGRLTRSYIQKDRRHRIRGSEDEAVRGRLDLEVETRVNDSARW
jgi:hypothetical protein